MSNISSPVFSLFLSFHSCTHQSKKLLWTYSWNLFSGKLLTHLKYYLLWFSVPRWLSERECKDPAWGPPDFAQQMDFSLGLILCLLVPSLVPCTTLLPGVWWGHTCTGTLSWSHWSLPGSSHARWNHPAFFPELIHCCKRQFAKCMQAVKVWHWQLISHFHYSSFTGNFPSTCGGIHSVVPLEN